MTQGALPFALIRRSGAVRADLSAALLLALLCAMLFSLFPARSASATDFLDPAEAFKFSAHMVDRDHVEVHYAIAKGYYLYKERFHFAAEPASASLGAPDFPPAEVKFDETFGKNVEHYRNDVIVRIPVASSGPFTLVSTAQGCADAGLCYPPQESRLSLDPASAAASSSSSAPTNQAGTPPAAADK